MWTDRRAARARLGDGDAFDHPPAPQLAGQGVPRLVLGIRASCSRRGTADPFPLPVQGVTAPWWFTLAGWLGIVPADFVMSRDMLQGVKQRAEALARERSFKQHESAG